jgi:hypothetical protein
MLYDHLGGYLAKLRVSVPEEVRAKILLESARTCCVCQVPGRSVQLHHINDDPSDNSDRNLAVLCLDCHNETQVSGGFGRHLSAADVRVHRDNWIRRVQERRERADQIAVDRMTRVGETEGQRGPAPGAALLPYVESLPAALQKAYELACPRWEEGSMADSRQATYDVIDVVERILVHLAAWCPPRHFGREAAEHFFSQHVTSRFLWRRGLAEAVDGGNITVQLAAAAVLDDVERDVASLVQALIEEDHPEEWALWSKRWAAACAYEGSRLGCNRPSKAVLTTLLG